MEISGLRSAIRARRFLLVALLLVLHTEAANTTVSSGVSGQHRKLVTGARDKCKNSDLSVSQGLSTDHTYDVEISNQCSSGCSIARIHLHCGAFSSQTLVNPSVFRRVNFDDCVVNDGKPIAFGGVVSFQYVATEQYPLSVNTFTCF